MNTRQWISRSGGLAVEAQEELRALAPQLVLVFAAPGRSFILSFQSRMCLR